jgi:hypothetical protein
MHIGPVYKISDGLGGTTIASVSRHNRMHASTSDNLNRFLADYKKAGSFGLVPAVTPEGETFPQPMWEFIQPRQKLEVRAAWTIDENDPDMVIIQDDDDPIIPDGESDPPIKRAIARMKAMRERRRGGRA